MLPKGLPHGQNFLLVTEEGIEAAGYTPSVLQLHEDQWGRLEPQSSRILRESMLEALLEFFGKLCRILNHSSDCTHRIKSVTPKGSRPTLSQQPSVPTAPMRQFGQRPGKTASRQLHVLKHHEHNP